MRNNKKKLKYYYFSIVKKFPFTFVKSIEIEKNNLYKHRRGAIILKQIQWQSLRPMGQTKHLLGYHLHINNAGTS